MFKDSINGLNRLFSDGCDIPAGSMILVSGREGTLKSGLVFNIISGYLECSGEHGLYATLEENWESLLRNMNSLGIEKSEQLHVFDYRDVRVEWESEELDVVKVTEDMIEFYMKKYKKQTVFALDSLNALYSISSQINLRKKMYHFFTMLREKNLTSFLIMERSSYDRYSDCAERPENFLADGIIELGVMENQENVKRYIQIKKMRGADHSMEKHQLIVGKDGISILGTVY